MIQTKTDIEFEVGPKGESLYRMRLANGKRIDVTEQVKAGRFFLSKVTSAEIPLPFVAHRVHNDTLYRVYMRHGADPRDGCEWWPLPHWDMQAAIGRAKADLDDFIGMAPDNQRILSGWDYVDDPEKGYSEYVRKVNGCKVYLWRSSEGDGQWNIQWSHADRPGVASIRSAPTLIGALGLFYNALAPGDPEWVGINALNHKEKHELEKHIAAFTRNNEVTGDLFLRALNLAKIAAIPSTPKTTADPETHEDTP